MIKPASSDIELRNEPAFYCKTRVLIVMFALICVLAGCQVQEHSGLPEASEKSGSSVAKLKLTKIEYFDKNRNRISFKSFSRTPAFNSADTHTPDYFINYDNQSSSATNDYCYGTVASADAHVCSVQGGYAELYWYLGDEGAGITVSFYADGPANTVASSNTFNSSQIDTTETISAASAAPVTMNNVYHVYATCNGTICAEASIQFGVLCSLTNGTCPLVTMTDNKTGQQFVPNDSPTPVSVIGAPQSFTGKQIPGSGSGSYNNEGQYWSFATAHSASDAVVENYTMSDNVASVQYLSQSDVSSPTISFYWITSDSLGLQQTQSFLPNPIQFSEILQRSDGQEISQPSISESYAIEGPIATEMTGVSAQPTYGPYELTGATLTPALHLGTKLANAVTPLGVSVQLTGTMPRDYAGSVALTRLVNFSTSSTANPGQSPAPDVSNGQDFWADTCALYTRSPLGNDGSSKSLTLNASAPIAYKAESAPAYFPNALTTQSFNAQEIYHDYFMFKPSVANAIWVPVQIENWSWSGLVSLQNGKYEMVTDSYPTSPFFGVSPTATIFTDEFAEPQWSQRRSDGLPCHPV